MIHGHSRRASRSSLNAAEVMTTIRELGERNIVLRSLREYRVLAQEADSSDTST
jgi:hypothetical protein